jgi:hypothetical protein
VKRHPRGAHGPPRDRQAAAVGRLHGGAQGRVGWRVRGNREPPGPGGLPRAKPRPRVAGSRSITPTWLPKKPGCTAGVPWRVPARPSTPALRAGGGTPEAPGKTWWVWPATRASMPGSAATARAAFSWKGSASAPPMPEWQSATTRSAPAARRCGTFSRAASRMLRVRTTPPKLAAVQAAICGGARPITPTRTGQGRPLGPGRAR